MRTKTFTVPLEQMIEFASLIEEYDLTNRIVEPENDSIVVEVDYDPEDKHAIFEIMELIDEEL